MFWRTLIGYAVVASTAAATTSGAQRSYDFQREVLDNGLTLVTLEDHSCPVVAVQMVYHVGSKDDDPNHQGSANLLQRVMSQGLRRADPNGHLDRIRRRGGYCRAKTTFDETTYAYRLPASELELALWLEAERMAFPRIDEMGLYQVRAGVEAERRRLLDAPYGTALEKVQAAMFAKHPYRCPTAGTIAHLRATTIDDLQAFWDKYYVPANATLVIVGDVAHADALALARRYFGWIPKMPAPPRCSTEEPAQTAPRTVTVPEKKGPAPIVALAYRAVPQGHEDALPLQMLMSILCAGRSSRIYRDLVEAKKLAQEPAPIAFTFEHHGVIGVRVAVMPWGDKEKVLAALHEHLRRLKSEPVTPEELAKARNNFLRDEVDQLLTVEGKAGALAKCQVIEGDADKANRRLERIRGVKAEDLLRVAKTYLVEQHQTTVLVQPEKGLLGALVGEAKKRGPASRPKPPPKPAGNRVAKAGGARANLKRPEGFPTRPPAAARSETVRETPRHDATLPNGLKVVVVPNHEAPHVTLRLGLLNGGWTEERPGTAMMASMLLTRATEQHASAALAEVLELNAIRLRANVWTDAGTVDASCVTDRLETAAKLLAEVVRSPAFPADRFEAMRKQMVKRFASRRTWPALVAHLEFQRRIYGDHPYARSPQPDQADLEALTAAELKAWWRRSVRPDSTVLYLAGDVDPQRGLQVARDSFGDWKADGAGSPPTPPETPKPSRTHIWLIDWPKSGQTYIYIGHVGIPQRHEDYLAGRVLSAVLGRGSNCRLRRALRAEKNLSDRAGGGFSSRQLAGAFTVSAVATTANTVRTLQVLLKEIYRTPVAPATPKELADARSELLREQIAQGETPQAVVDNLWRADSAGLPPDHLTQMRERVRTMTARDVSAAAKRLMKIRSLTIVVLGEADKLKTDLEMIAPVTVVQPPPSATQPAKRNAAG